MNILILERAYPYREEGPALSRRLQEQDIQEADIVVVISATTMQVVKNNENATVEIKNDD